MRKTLSKLSKAAVILAALVLVSVTAGYIGEHLIRLREVRLFPPAGRMVDVGGRSIEIDCRGSGHPIVVFEAGMDTYGALSWTAVQPAVSTFTRACSYSRAGIMWSDPSGAPLSAKSVAKDLHDLLKAAGESGPYVIVAHSLSGAYAMEYTKLYGPEVAGLVLVDVAHPDDVRRVKQIIPDIDERDPVVPRSLRFEAWLASTGLTRFFVDSLVAPEHNQPVEIFHAIQAYAPASLAEVVAEGDQWDVSLKESGSFRNLGSRPLSVLTTGDPISESDLEEEGVTMAQGAALSALSKEEGDDEANWSSISQRVTVLRSGHYIQFDRPNVVIDATHWVVEKVRDRSQPSTFGR